MLIGSLRVWGYLCCVREEENPDDRGANDSTDIVLVPAGNRSNCLFGIDLFGGEVHGRATGNVETDSTCNRIKSYESVEQAARNGVRHFARDNEIGRREDRDRTEHECGKCRNDTYMNNFGKVNFGNIVADCRKGDNDQV